MTMQGSKCGIDGALGGGLGVTLGIYACANISNGHLNPAVTIAWTIQGRISLKLPVIQSYSQCEFHIINDSFAHSVFY